MTDLDESAEDAATIGPPVIGICGVAGSGKSTAARILLDDHYRRRLRFAQPLKAMTGSLLSSAGLTWSTRLECVDGRHKETGLKQLCGASSREIMQTLGDEWGRQCIHPDLWVEIARPAAESYLAEGVPVVFDDVRYANEAAMIRELGGEIWRMEGRAAPGVRPHASEEIDFAADVTIDNSGDVDALVATVALALKGSLGMRSSLSEAVINDLREVTIEEIFEAIASDPKAAASLSFRAADAAIKRIAELEAELDAIRSRGERAA